MSIKSWWKIMFCLYCVSAVIFLPLSGMKHGWTQEFFWYSAAMLAMGLTSFALWHYSIVRRERSAAKWFALYCQVCGLDPATTSQAQLNEAMKRMEAELKSRKAPEVPRACGNCEGEGSYRTHFSGHVKCPTCDGGGVITDKTDIHV